MCIARLHFQNSCREFGLLPNFVEMEGALIHKTGDHLVSAFAMQRKKKASNWRSANIMRNNSRLEY